MFVVVLLALLAAPAYSDTVVRATWTAPAFYTNGKPLPAAEISRYIIRYTGTRRGTQYRKGTAMSVTLPPGVYTFTVRAQAVNGQISDPSNAVTVTVAQ